MPMKVFEELGLLSRESEEDLNNIDNEEPEEDRVEEILTADLNKEVSTDLLSIESYFKELNKLDNESSYVLSKFQPILSGEEYTTLDLTLAYESLRMASKAIKYDMGIYQLSHESIRNHPETAYELACEGFGSFLSHVIRTIGNILERIWEWLKNIGIKFSMRLGGYESKIKNYIEIINNLPNATKAPRSLSRSAGVEISRRLAQFSIGHANTPYKPLVELLSQMDIGPYNDNKFGSALIGGMKAAMLHIHESGVTNEMNDNYLALINAKLISYNPSTSLNNIPRYLDVDLPANSTIHILCNTGNKIDALLFANNKFSFGSFNLHPEELDARSNLQPLSKAEMLDLLKRLQSSRYNINSINSLSNTMIDYVKELQKELKKLQDSVGKGSQVKSTMLSYVLKLSKITISIYSKYLYQHTMDCYNHTLYAVSESIKSYNQDDNEDY